jgi:hypothetical protein
MSYLIPDGASVATVKGRVQAVGVALLFTYSVNPFLFSSTLSVKESLLLS